MATLQTVLSSANGRPIASALANALRFQRVRLHTGDPDSLEMSKRNSPQIFLLIHAVILCDLVLFTAYDCAAASVRREILSEEDTYYFSKILWRALKRLLILISVGVPNMAFAETWYCSLFNDPTTAVHGQKVYAYRVVGSTVKDLTGERDSNELAKDDPELRKQLAETDNFKILRNDNNYLIAEVDYPWNGALNIEVISIDKIHGSFTKSLIWTGKPESTDNKGGCTKAFE